MSATFTSDRLTVRQFQALDWLPSDGSWRSQPGWRTAGLNSLAQAWCGCLEAQWGAYGFKGREDFRWRLTDEGLRRAAALLELSAA